MDEERKKEMERRVKELQGESWGMDTRHDDVVSNNDSNQENDTGPPAEDIELLNIDNLLMYADKYNFTDKQKQQLQKIDQMRRKLKTMIDKQATLQKAEDCEFDETKIQSQLEKLDK